MIQKWRNLSFLHFAADPEEIQKTLPEGLTVDTFPDSSGKEKAWVGLVPFDIPDLTLGRRLRVPTASSFLETNVRTYVHCDGKLPGVWFYSLDAQSRLACLGARASFGLPYYPARMSFQTEGSLMRYKGERGSNSRIAYEVEVEVGPPRPSALPGSLNFFLIERYLLFSRFMGKLLTCQVHHHPYPLREAITRAEMQTLTQAGGIPTRPFTTTHFSDGVDVEIFPLRPIPSC